MNSIQILATGHAVPMQTLDNETLSTMVDTNDEWIVSRTGIKKRHISQSENTSVLATQAAKMALEKSQIAQEKIRYLIVATFTPDNYTPSTACLVARNLGLNHQQLMAFDLNAACSGFIYALTVMKNLLKDDEYGLVIGSEVISKMIDWKDRSTCILFGDGAGAVVVKGKNDGIFYDMSGTQGNEDVLYCHGRHFNHRKEGTLQMNGKEVFKFAVEAIQTSIQNLLDQSDLTLDDIDHVVCHQANYRIISYVIKKLKADAQKFYINLDEYGNTSAASIPLALSEMNEKGFFKKGQRVILVGFGAGLTWGATLFEW